MSLSEIGRSPYLTPIGVIHTVRLAIQIQSLVVGSTSFGVKFKDTLALNLKDIPTFLNAQNFNIFKPQQLFGDFKIFKYLTALRPKSNIFISNFKGRPQLITQKAHTQ